MIVSVRGWGGIKIVHPRHVRVTVRVVVISEVWIECSCISHTRTLGLARVDGEAEVAAFAHGRAVRGAVSTGFGGTVRAIAYVG